MVMAFVQSKRVVIMAFLRRIVADMADAFAASEIPEDEMPSSRIDVLRMIGKDRIVEETATVSARHVRQTCCAGWCGTGCRSHFYRQFSLITELARAIAA